MRIKFAEYNCSRIKKKQVYIHMQGVAGVAVLGRKCDNAFVNLHTGVLLAVLNFLNPYYGGLFGYTTVSI